MRATHSPCSDAFTSISLEFAHLFKLVLFIIAIILTMIMIMIIMFVVIVVIIILLLNDYYYYYCYFLIIITIIICIIISINNTITYSARHYCTWFSLSDSLIYLHNATQHMLIHRFILD